MDTHLYKSEQNTSGSYDFQLELEETIRTVVMFNWENVGTNLDVLFENGLGESLQGCTLSHSQAGLRVE